MMVASVAPASEPFGRAVNDLLRESEWVTSTGAPNLHAFAEQLDGVHYESLRKAMAGERIPTPALMEEVARVLRVKPTHFVEYRLLETQREFDVRQVGFQKALENLADWSKKQTRGR